MLVDIIILINYIKCLNQTIFLFLINYDVAKKIDQVTVKFSGG